MDLSKLLQPVKVPPKFIPREELGKVSAWSFGDINGRDRKPAPEPELTRSERAALDKGYRAGLEAGRAEAQASSSQAIELFYESTGADVSRRMSSLCEAYEQQLKGLEQNLAVQVLDLAFDIARQLIRSELATQPKAIEPMVHEAVNLVLASGAGKSVLLGMMARYTSADVIVVGLIGERGREVKEFIEEILGLQGRERAVVVAAPADAPPLIRMQGANYATAIAEHFRDQGLHVLLLMDSLTRYAMAQREIALAIGEPPATRGYPPSCFAKLPTLVERSGNGLKGIGSITAIYTVLSEGDDQQDPIADTSRAILDGHIVLTRSLAESGHYPAIDVEQSISRVMHSVVSPGHLEAARQCKRLYARYQRSRDLIQLGAYVPGQDMELDRAVAAFPAIEKLLLQDLHEQSSMQTGLQSLMSVVDAGQVRSAMQPGF